MAEAAMKLRTQIMFQGEMEDAITLWSRAFPDAQREGTNPCRLLIAGQELALFDSPPMHEFTFTPSISLLVECESEAELSRLAEILAGGGAVLMPQGAYDFSPCYIWLTDRFGVSWQLMVPPEAA
ncbi:MAG: VOC family protein [Paracoccus sp. (in: a-proteobacteria)]|nr:VOC family protein [Paracoccus sp. (in: a-proteobacteria)]